VGNFPDETSDSDYRTPCQEQAALANPKSYQKEMLQKEQKEGKKV
jgi:hypothetical protein